MRLVLKIKQVNGSDWFELIPNLETIYLNPPPAQSKWMNQI